MFNQHVRLEQVSALLLLRRGGKGSAGCSDHFSGACEEAPATHSITYIVTLWPGFASHQIPSAAQSCLAVQHAANERIIVRSNLFRWEKANRY
jgi:hypothetical protein